MKSQKRGPGLKNGAMAIRQAQPILLGMGKEQRGGGGGEKKESGKEGKLKLAQAPRGPKGRGNRGKGLKALTFKKETEKKVRVREGGSEKKEEGET